MLHILLLILKIIGIIIAVILGILVLAVCVVLFVPIRYQMTASCDGTLAGIHARARVTWLMHLVRLYISYENRKLSWRVGIAWKSIRSGKEDKKTIKTEVKTNGEEVEGLWEDLEDDLEEEAGEEYEERRKACEVDEEGSVEGIRKVCEEKEDESVQELLEEWDRLMEGHHEERKSPGKESGEAVERDQKEPEKLLARLEQEMERILETGDLPEEEEAGDPGVWEEACEGFREDQEDPVDSRQGPEGRAEAYKGGKKEPEAANESSGQGEREACEDGGKEEREACEDGSQKEHKICRDSRQEPEVAYRSVPERDEGSSECEEQRREGSESSGKGWKCIWRKLTDGCRKFIRKVSALYQKIAGIPGRVRGTVQGICDRIETLSGKKDKILDFLTDKIHRAAFAKVMDEAFRLLRKLKPRKLQGKIRYGFEDPYLTGKLLAGFGMAYPFLGDDLEIYPDFERRILKGRLEAAGRLRVSCFVKLLWNLVWCREVRMTYRHVREFEL